MVCEARLVLDWAAGGQLHLLDQQHLQVTAGDDDDYNDDDDDQDKSSAKHNLDEFLKGAYAKQMKELNGTTGELEPSLSPCLLLITCINHLCKTT